MGREPSGMLRRLVIGIVCICACTGFRGNPPLCILCLCLAFQCLIMMTACGELRAFRELNDPNNQSIGFIASSLSRLAEFAMH